MIRAASVPYDSGESDVNQCADCTTGKQEKETAGKEDQKPNHCHPRNYSWSELLRRVFEIDILECPKCGDRMRILCAVNPPDAIQKILDCLGLPTRPPPAFAKASTDKPIYSAVQEHSYDY